MDENVDVTIDVASVCYTHSPRFIKELDETATEFKNYIAKFKESLKVILLIRKKLKAIKLASLLVSFLP